ncbi:alpha/beta hydrolase [Citricoccus sp. SGAir0253]|uniref:alpha/beta fold hydrolase n=1 Tax=Citricoccus sp. SGAir0253 TaxID=2567881 RepID=UPI0010CCC01A|nr:alpha/beta hydrolase [Citricoccus sp. SGAir0253]QCU78457.1 alpha/beta hydrolase [Citricoccus sp. SGAir0253]
MTGTPQATDAASPLEDNHRHTGVGPGYRQATVAVAGGPMTVGLWGPEDPGAPTVLAVHGVSASHRSFGLLAAALPGVRLVAPDLRGRGRSNRLPAPYGMPAHADDLAAVLGELAAGPVVVVGHSMGAFATLVLAHRHPRLVSSLVLVDGGIPLALPPGLDPDQVVQAVLGPAADRLAMRFGSVDDYRRFWSVHPAFQGAWDPAAGTAGLMDDYITYDLEQDPEPDRTGLRPATRYEAMAQDTAELQGGESLLAALQHLAVPARLLWTRRGLLGGEPGLFTAEYIADWQRRVPALAEHLTVREVPGTNHYTIVMAPDGAAAVAEEVTAALGAGDGRT